MKNKFLLLAIVLFFVVNGANAQNLLNQQRNITNTITPKLNINIPNTQILSSLPLISRPKNADNYDWFNNAWRFVGKSAMTYYPNAGFKSITELTTNGDTLTRTTNDITTTINNIQGVSKYQYYNSNTWKDSLRNTFIFDTLDFILGSRYEVFDGNFWDTTDATYSVLTRAPCQKFLLLRQSTSCYPTCTYNKDTALMVDNLLRPTYSLITQQENYPTATRVDTLYRRIYVFNANNNTACFDTYKEDYWDTTTYTWKPLYKITQNYTYCDPIISYKDQPNNYTQVLHDQFSADMDSIVGTITFQANGNNVDVYDKWRNGNNYLGKFRKTHLNLPNGSKSDFTEKFINNEWEGIARRDNLIDNFGNYTDNKQMNWVNGAWNTIIHLQRIHIYNGIDLVETSFYILDAPTSMMMPIGRFVYSNYQQFNVAGGGISTDPTPAPHTNVKVYPNPVRSNARGSINVQFGEGWAGSATVAIYDAMGKKITQQTTQATTTTINISGLAAGIYTLKVSGNNANTTHKLVVY
jgi:hypothetical protein